VQVLFDQVDDDKPLHHEWPPVMFTVALDLIISAFSNSEPLLHVMNIGL
jgi:hypothetical protein